MPDLPQPLLFKDPFPFPITRSSFAPPESPSVRPIRQLAARYAYPNTFSCRITFSIERNGEVFNETNSLFYVPGIGLIITLTRQNPRLGISGDLFLEKDLFYQNPAIPFNDNSPEQALLELNHTPHYTGSFSMTEATAVGEGSLGNPYGSEDRFEFDVNFYDFTQGYYPPYPSTAIEQVFCGPSLTYFDNQRGTVEFAAFVEGALGTTDVPGDPFYAFTKAITAVEPHDDAIVGSYEEGSMILMRPPQLIGNAPNQTQGGEHRYTQPFGLHRLLNGNLDGATSTCPSLTLEIVETGRLQYRNPTPTAPTLPEFDWGTLE